MPSYKGQSRDIGFSATGIDNAIRKLEGMGDAALHARPVLNAIGELVLEEEDERWGKGWKPDSPATVRRKGNADVGTDSGGLRESLTKRGARWNIFRVLNGELVVGTSAPHAHLFDRGRKGQPRRRAIRLGRKVAREAMAKLILEWIVRHNDE